MNPNTAKRDQRIWSLELVLVIALPLAAVVACLFTLYLALKHPAHESLPIDRFGHVVEQRR